MSAGGEVPPRTRGPAPDTGTTSGTAVYDVEVKDGIVLAVVLVIMYVVAMGLILGLIALQGLANTPH